MLMRWFLLSILGGVLLILCLNCSSKTASSHASRVLDDQIKSSSLSYAAGDYATPVQRVIRDALEQTTYTLIYDPAYKKIAYPGGDVPLERGACTDVLIRAFRKAGIDLQKEVHEDMSLKFNEYPKKWGLSNPDTNIDHRRVPNLMKYFERKDKEIPISNGASDYYPGDIVAWDLGGGLTHIGLVTDVKARESSNYLMVHNIGRGARIEDVLFSWQIIGHYRYFK